MTLKSEDLTVAIKALENSVREKYRSFKQSSIQTDRENEAKFKPLIGPLRSIKEQMLDVKKEIKEEPKVEYLPEYTDEIGQEYEHSSVDTQSDDEGTIVSENFSRRSSIESDFDMFVRTNNIGDLLATYLKFIQSDDREGADFTYGIHYDGNNWKIGSVPIHFSDNDIIINDVVYKGTPGLFELIFKKHPQSIFNENDLKTYKRILEVTGVHKRSNGRQIKANKGYKYTNIISNMFPPRIRKQPTRIAKDEHTTIQTKKRPTQPMSPFVAQKRQKVGDGLLMEVNQLEMHYKYWNDPNELVDRLRLLIASKKAGNTSHNNEIIAILEELEEAEIIKGFSNFQL